MYAKLLLSSKTIAWHLSAEQHLSMFRCETPAKACGCARSAWAGQPQPCLRVNCKPPGWWSLSLALLLGSPTRCKSKAEASSCLCEAAPGTDACTCQHRWHRDASHCCQGPGWQGHVAKQAPARTQVRLGRKDAMLTIAR